MNKAEFIKRYGNYLKEDPLTGLSRLPIPGFESDLDKVIESEREDACRKQREACADRICTSDEAESDELMSETYYGECRELILYTPLIKS